MKWSRKHLVFAGLALVVATNAVVLAGVLYNRGEVDSTLKLSERELQPGWTPNRRENSGLTMHLRWRVLGAGQSDAYDIRHGGVGGYQSPTWLDAAKMAALGFDTSKPDTPDTDRRTYRNELARDVLLVLEVDGPTHKKAIEAAVAEAARLRTTGKPDSVKLADEIVPVEKDVNSRLFVVDAGLDAATLRAKYPDRARYAIVHGRVRPAGVSGREGRGSHGGYVDGIANDNLHAPLEFKPAFEGAVAGYSGQSSTRARYEATVQFGKRLEPWIAQAAKLKAP